MNRATLSLVSALLLAAWLAPTPAIGGKSSDKDITVEDAKKGANQALDEVEKAVKSGARAVKEGGNDALQSIDDAIHNRPKKRAPKKRR